MKQYEFTNNIKLHAGALRSHALKFTNDIDDANDLLQDTLVKATRFAAKFDQRANIKGWLFIIMRNTFISRYRKQQRERERVLQVEEISSATLYKRNRKPRQK
ncbi:RNA polymerase sigma factor [Pedobacter alluvionis]|uniref:RNA polymerase sigma factor n=1 Tax=Pedobacter alluvionis TaxID=475253 RepID=A0A497XT29_9SPHI|nr:RNA polymerase sigma factor [Pedobacter alluvionis]RLJ72600.1 RNA polymerase sigma-70 factor (ECF subfamily) [Pedobacter alluvionis]TFB28087.1 RNA polymerase sigma factor [Pedobacter alluvionis]